MKKIFLTGATGVMGSHALRELTARSGQYSVTVLARDCRKNREKLSPYLKAGVKVIWGDLLDPKAVAEGVGDADIVLHVGGMVSPAADWNPQQTIRVNVGSMRNIIDAAILRKNDVRVVYIGSVSQYGPRKSPNHWAQCGDPLFPALFDAYAYSKIMAEKILLESGLRWWVSLRQTGILHSGMLKKASDPISFHVPLKGVIEWVTAEDSGRLLERVCRDSVPDSFWCRCYNVGGGAPFRLTNYEFECRILDAMGCPPPEKIFETRWFAADNFHGLWYSDSDLLEDMLHFRKGTTPEEYLSLMKKELPWYFSLAPLAPAFLIKAFMRKVTHTPGLGTMWWIEHDDESRIKACWGSRREWEAIPGWEDFDLARPSDKPANCGTDSALCNEADPDELLHLRCGKCGNEYSMKSRTYAAGHRCPACLDQACGLNEKSFMTQLR